MQNTIFNILKYIGLGATIYLIFKFVPNFRMSNIDMIIITIIILLIYIIFDYLCNLNNNNISLKDNNNLCTSVCKINKEHMTNINEETKTENLNKEVIIDNTNINDKEKITDIEVKTNNKIKNDKEKNVINFDNEYYNNFNQDYYEFNYYKNNFNSTGDDINKKWYPQMSIPIKKQDNNTCPSCPPCQACPSMGYSEF